MKYLVQRIKAANDAYRKGEEIMSDQEYDELIETLRKLDENHPLLAKGIIEEATGGRKQKLPYRMGSLDKLGTLEEIEKWIEKKQLQPGTIIILTPKFDGASLLVDEKEDKAWTRGDGEVGQKSDIHYARVNNGQLRNYITFGEVILQKSVFKKMTNREMFLKPYKNGRNMAAGLFNADEASDDLEYVNYVRFGFMGTDWNKDFQLDEANRMNDKDAKVPYRKMKIEEITENLLNEIWEDWINTLDYELDGIVIDINDAQLRNHLGIEKNGNPAYARAIKLGWEEKAITKVKHIEWNVSRTGRIKPVIIIEPTQLAGAEVNRATAHNYQYLRDHKIYNGALIRIKRSGEVIPKHIETLKESKFGFIKYTCPSCNGDVKFEGKEMMCSNPDYCKGVQTKKIATFFAVMGVEEFGLPTVYKLWDANYTDIKSILDIPIEEMIKINGIGMTNAKKWKKQFEEKCKTTTFEKLGKALGAFELMGERKLKMFDSLWDKNIEIEDNLMTAFSESFTFTQKALAIKGIGEETIYDFLKAIPNFLGEVRESGVKMIYEKKEKIEIKGSKYEGMIFVFTKFRDKEIELMIQENGGIVGGSVNNKTTHLVVKDIEGKETNKMKAAREKGIKIIGKGFFGK